MVQLPGETASIDVPETEQTLEGETENVTAPVPLPPEDEIRNVLPCVTEVGEFIIRGSCADKFEEVDIVVGAADSFVIPFSSVTR